MTAQATPTITVAGLTIPPTSSTGLRAVDRLTIKWGRTSILSRPTPATAEVTIRDTSLDAAFARRDDLIGKPLVLGYTITADTLETEGNPRTGVNFRGRITDVDVYPRKAGGFDVKLAASSREVDAANYAADKGTVWPAEQFSARLARILGLLPAGFFADAVLPGEWPAAQMDVGGTDALTLLRQFYDSAGARPMVYDPDGNRVMPGGSWSAPSLGAAGALSAQLVVDPARAGRYVVKAIAGQSMDSRQLEHTGPLSQPIDSRLTLVAVQFRSDAVGYAQRTVGAATDLFADEATDGRRSLTVDSIHAVTANATALAREWATAASSAGHTPRLDPLRYETARNGGFDTDWHAIMLLKGTESGLSFFVRSTWITRLRARPLFGVLGSTITYARGQWSVTFSPAPITPAVPTQPLRIRYAATPGVRLRDIDRSVTLGDLRFVDVGAGFTSTTQPPWGAP